MSSNEYFRRKSRELYLEQENNKLQPEQKIILKTPTKDGSKLFKTVTVNKSKYEKPPPVLRNARSVLRRGSVPVLNANLAEKIHKNEKKTSLDENYSVEKEKFRLVVLGAPKVGKSSIINKFLYEKYTDDYTQTVENLYAKTFNLLGKEITASILDTSGDDSFSALGSLHIANGDGFVLVYAVDDAGSWQHVKKLHDEIMKKHDPSTPIVVVGNKCDLEATREVSKICTEMLVELDWEKIFLETSAKTDDTVDVFEAITNQAKLVIPLCPGMGNTKVEHNSKILNKRRSSVGLLNLYAFTSLSKQNKGSTEKLSHQSNCKVQ